MTSSFTRMPASFHCSIAACAARCYGVIADYRVGHPAIVPPRAFGPLVVEQVGFGQGFVVIFRHRVHARRHGKDAAFRQGQIQIRAGQGQADHLAGVAGQARPGRGLGGQEGIQGGERGGEQ